FRLDQPAIGADPAVPDPLNGGDVRNLVAANLYTAGQFFGLMFSFLLGTLLMTNEFQHQTASVTFLATPDRTRVVIAKLITAVMVGMGFWVLATTVDI